MANELHAEDLDKKFGIPNALKFQGIAGGLVHAAVSTPEAEGTLYLQGAHVEGWTPKGQRPVLFTSSKSLFTAGKAIRGGVPIIFPWFGARGEGKPGPAHGFARTMLWEVESTSAEGGKVTICVGLKSNDATTALGYGPFHLRFRVSFGGVLEMELETQNQSSSELMFEEALHTYLAIGDIGQASVTGLEGTTYIDKTDGFKRKQLGSEPVKIAKETDQVHLNSKSTCVVHDDVWHRRIFIEKSGSDSTVVWNPWVEKTAGMSDMAPGDWREMICVETANAADNAVRLAAGASHSLRAVVRVE